MVVIYSWDQIVAWLGVVAPLMAIAWSGHRYVRVQQAQQRAPDFENFFETLGRVHNEGKSLLTQKAAIFELRSYPGYKGLFLRICASPEAFFPGLPKTLKFEFTETATHLGPR